MTTITKQTRPYGSWESPITTDLLVQLKSSFGDITVDPTTKTVFWLSNLPEEDGRGAVYAKRLGHSESVRLTPAPYNCRTRVHEYGGGAFTVRDNILIFSNDADFRLYRIDLAYPEKITPVIQDSSKKYRYADLHIHPSGDFLLAIREEHMEDDRPETVVSTIVAIRLNVSFASGHNVHTLASGHDFYSSPRLNPADPTRLVYVAWDHPNMPWDFTQLHEARLHIDPSGAISIASTTQLAGDTIDESIVQPKFASDGTLYFASDRSGFWNLYRADAPGAALLLLPHPVEEEFADPAWVFNTSSYDPLPSHPHRLIASHGHTLSILDTKTRTLTDLPTGFTNHSAVRALDDTHVVFLGSSPSQNSTIVAFNLKTRTTLPTIATSGPALSADIISHPQLITFPTTNNKHAYGYYYPPTNPSFQAPANTLPPLRVLSHGGPTSACSDSFNVPILYWTSRGFAVVNVNYGGSSGYGREFRNRLRGQWGVVDVDDCCNAARYLVAQGLVDPQKLAIQGESAGGYTTLACLAFRDVFTVGCSLYGISDITLLAKDTHKFESRYPDGLIGPYPEKEELYHERSPIHSADKILCPCIFFQGLEDNVVPPAQSEIMVEAIKKKSVPVAYVAYEGEAHGFRKAANIKRTVELELWFYGKMWGFEPADRIEEIPISNMVTI
ncbi:Alpha/Beta hydrolase protein [Jimgerdemannia flammicorona]|uniref:Alpha/Beta hydrolase protein n=1 Tax=Jimgerdemannia flammicorona TaxID=994334 RepID=A0A433A0T5_9FUNG|nr:Alpha/Beta hydrolase protein [Jimgerdemannia flammicorona]